MGFCFSKSEVQITSALRIYVCCSTFFCQYFMVFWLVCDLTKMQKKGLDINANRAQTQW